MKHLKLELSKALEAYEKANKEQKQLLINLYGKEVFLIDIKDRINSYEDACKELGIEPLELSDFDHLPEWERKKAFNRHVLSVGTKALVQGWIPDFDNRSQYKYYNYYYRENNSFSSCVCSGYYGTAVGSDLMFQSEELAKHANKVFKQNYIDYLF